MGLLITRRARSLRTDAPTGNAAWGYTYRIHTTMKSNATWNPALYPPAESVPWSAEILYLRIPGRMENRLRTVGEWLRLCKKGPQWKRVQRIEIAK